MKNQWFGDMYDFRKYGLLEFLSCYYEHIVVSWMLTPDDSIYGIDIPKSPSILSNIKSLILQHRNIQYAIDYFKAKDEDKFIFWEENLKPTTFYESRKQWNAELSKMEKLYNKKSLYFFDADNGLSPTDCDKDEEKESKYIYQKEFQSKYEKGADILLYQHRQRSQSFKTMHQKVSEKLDKIQGPKKCICIKATGNVAFFLLCHDPDKIPFTDSIFKEKEDNEYMSIYPPEN